jgi:hypothetical protein
MQTMKSALVAVISLLLCSCVTVTKSVGTFDVIGIVVNAETGKPLNEVKVVLSHEAVTASDGSISIVLGSAFTDNLGNFFIPKNPTEIVGGVGGLSGYIMEWSTVSFIKDGYCKFRSPYKNSIILNKNAIVFKLTESVNCI